MMGLVRFLHKMVSNSFLMAVLMAMLFLPIGSMGLLTTQPNDVLSEKDYRNDQVIDYAPANEQYFYQRPDELMETTSSSAELRHEVDY